MIRTLVVLISLLLLVGCESDDKIAALEKEKAALSKQAAELRAENELLHKPEGDLTETLKLERETHKKEIKSLEADIIILKAKTVDAHLLHYKTN